MLPGGQNRYVAKPTVPVRGVVRNHRRLDPNDRGGIELFAAERQFCGAALACQGELHVRYYWRGCQWLLRAIDNSDHGAFGAARGGADLQAAFSVIENDGSGLLVSDTEALLADYVFVVRHHFLDGVAALIYESGDAHELGRGNLASAGILDPGGSAAGAFSFFAGKAKFGGVDATVLHMREGERGGFAGLFVADGDRLFLVVEVDDFVVGVGHADGGFGDTAASTSLFDENVGADAKADDDECDEHSDDNSGDGAAGEFLLRNGEGRREARHSEYTINNGPTCEAVDGSVGFPRHSDEERLVT